MELRRALLLFAIVLGMAAIAISVSRPPDRGQERDAGNGFEATAPRAPQAKPRPNGIHVAQINFAAAHPTLERLAAGRAATVSVSVPAPGQVELDGLGLSAAADPMTPARFELLENRPGVYEIRFTPAGGGVQQDAGKLAVVR